MVYSEAMMKNKQSKSLYLIFGVVIAVLLALIGYFAYLLIAPSDDTDTSTNTVNATANSNANKNKNANANKNANSNGNSNSNANTNNSNTNAGLVEPENSNTNTNSNSNTNSADETADEVVAGEGEEVITLYFPKDGASCGEVSPVKRAVTPSDDFYGQIILADLAGPTSEETGYDNAASGIRLRWVEYTSEGSIVYVNEAYDALNDCDKATVDAQLIQTANVMFDVKATADGKVVVGYPEGQDPNADATNDNSNTNTAQ